MSLTSTGVRLVIEKKAVKLYYILVTRLDQTGKVSWWLTNFDAFAIKDSFARGDRTYDLGLGTLGRKRYFWTCLQNIYRYSYYYPAVIRAQLLRLKRWLESRKLIGKGDRRELDV